MRPIDGTRIKEFLTCPRVPYFDFHAPKDEALPPTARMRILFESGRRHEAALLSGYDVREAHFPPGDFDAGLRATLALMQERAPAIGNGVLKLGEFLGRPDLLLLDPATGAYEVADIKSSQKVHAAAMLQVAFYARLLGQIAKPARVGHVIVRDGSRFTFALEDVAASLERVLVRLRDLRASSRSDPGPHRIEACDSCRWRERCLPDLEAGDDLSLVPDLTRAQKEALSGAGVGGMHALAAAEAPAQLARAAGLQTDLVLRVQRRAQALAAGRPTIHGAAREEVFAAGVALAALLDERAAEPLVAIAGVVLATPEKFRVRFLRRREARDPAAEYGELVRNLSRSAGPILIFGPSVRRAFEEGLDLVPAAADAVEGLLERMIDLRGELRRAVALPGFDHRPLAAARAAGLPVPDDDAVDLRALAWLEDAEGAEARAIEDKLRIELEAIARLRGYLMNLRDETLRGRGGVP